ncbi:EAL domain-containing protein [Oricola sp.]|uniref:EAL domain-containing protein n=1 Tax=Oricola sp. TaxID=1979950 RepID=UPI003BAD58E7
MSPRAGLLAAVLALIFIVSIFAARDMFVANQNKRTMDALAHSLVNRSELAFDYTVVKLAALHETGLIDCGPESVVALKHTVFVSGMVKDIVVQANGTACSATASGLAAVSALAPGGGFPARNTDFRVSALDIEGVPASAVTWAVSETIVATVILNTEALVFDALPLKLRDQGRAVLYLADGIELGAFQGAGALNSMDNMRFDAQSERYPFATYVSVSSDALAEFNMERNPVRVASSIFVCVVLAILVARGIMPPTPYHPLRKAFQRKEILPYFQPSYDLKTGRISGYEVLARWRLRDGTTLSPVSFIMAIEENRLTGQLLQTMVSETGRLMREIIDASPQTGFAFNVTPSQIIDRDFPEKLAGALNEAGLDASTVVIEITEREAIRDEKMAIQNIAVLARRGIATAIDDAGTGHNGLAALQRLGASVLKIDKLFVDTVDRDPRAAALIHMLVGVARDYGMKTIAEGVENAEQLSALIELGVDEAQGYYLSEPVEAQQAIEEFARNRAMLLQQQIQDGADAAATDREELLDKSA